MNVTVETGQVPKSLSHATQSSVKLGCCSLVKYNMDLVVCIHQFLVIWLGIQFRQRYSQIN